MSQMLPWLVLVAGAYLLGSVSFSLLIVRRVLGKDIRELGSGNAGATNVLRSAGRLPAAAVLLLDIGKGVLAVMVARWLDAPGPVIGAAALAAILGHIYPVYYGFRGGKGVATITGAFGTLAPTAAGLAALVFLLVVATTRIVSLGSVVGSGVFPFLIFAVGRFGVTDPAPPWLLITAALGALLVVFKHRENLRRIVDGNERRLGEPRSAG